VRASVIATVAAVALTALVPPVRATVPGDGWIPRPATYGVAVQSDVLITMSDGARLDADLHFPALSDGTPAPGPFPVLLVQTPYNKNQQNPAIDYLVQRGYVDVIVDIRGTGGSEGIFDQTFSTRSQLDGKELVEWAASQPWSTGNVGLHGESYYAINQLLTAAQQPQGLRAMFPVVPTGDNYRTNFPGGYLTSLAVFTLLYASDGAVPPGYTFDDPLQALRTMSARPESVVAQIANSAGLLAGDARSYDGAGYHAMSPLWLLDRITTPTFLVGGWYDALSQRDAPLMFAGLQARGVPVKLLMGPWYHTTAGSGLPNDGVPSLQELQLRWFDHFVRGDADADLDTFGPVIYSRLGTAGFTTAPTWPPPGVSYTHEYLGGSSAPLGTAGTLGATPGSSGPDVLPWLPVAGVCTRSTYIGTFGLAPSTPCETDDRVNDLTGLTYELPVTQDLDLTGPMSAHLYVSTSTSDAFVTLHLEDVDPATGTANEITSGWDSLALRALDESRSTIVGDDVVIPFHPYTQESMQQLSAGQIYDWWVEIRPVAATIPAGHRLRLSLQTADAVRFLPTAARLAGTAGSVLRVYHDADHPSLLVLPVTND